MNTRRCSLFRTGIMGALVLYVSLATAHGQATITSPTPGSTLSGSTVTFIWNNTGAPYYFLYVGTSVGASDVYYSGYLTATSQQVTGIPTSGTIYVRLWTDDPSLSWVYNDYQYTGGTGASPFLTITKVHSGNFTRGQTGVYTIGITNGGTAPTSGTVTVADTLPTGLTLSSMAGTGWSCPAGTTSCTRSDALAAGSSYPSITLTVNVLNSAPNSVTNSATVSGGGSAGSTANDPTSINSSGGGGAAVLSKEYVRLSGQVLAIENASNAGPFYR